MKKLQLLVTHYNEDLETITPLFDSIEMQKDIPFKQFSVIVVNDGNENVIPQSFFDKYSYKIDYYVIDHVGVSGARNYALSKATAEYVMFNDIDDCFFLDCAFFWLFREVKNKPDVFNSVFVEEKNGEHLVHKHDNTFIHGKAWNRKYLLENDLKFDEELQYHEDGYFVLLAQSCANVIRYFEYPFYLWKERKGSVARQENYIQNTWCSYLLAKRKVITQLDKRGLNEVSQFVVNSLIIEARERNLNKDNLIATAKFIDEYRETYEAFDKARRKELEDTMRGMYGHEVTTSVEDFDYLLSLIK